MTVGRILFSNFDVYMDIVVKTLAGLEGVLAKEMEAIGFRDIVEERRAVRAKGSTLLMYRANLELRTALRVLVPIKRFTANDDQELYQAVYDIPWPDYFTVEHTFAIDSVVFSSVFTHSQYVSLKTKDAIADRFRKEFGVRPSVNVENPTYRINIYIDETEVSISFDSSGDSLHKRGYRQSQGRAPLNEVLAAGMILLSGWDRETPFVDPMCGSGTLVIEAGLMAKNIAPGLIKPKFGFQNWPDFEAELWRTLYLKAKNSIRPDVSAPIIGSDRDPDAFKQTIANVKAAHLTRYVQVKNLKLEQFEPPAGPGTVIINPPYDERIAVWQVENFYRMIGDRLKKAFTDYDAWIISSHLQALKRIGLSSSQKIALNNGPLKCRYIQYELYAGSKLPIAQQQEEE